MPDQGEGQKRHPQATQEYVRPGIVRRFAHCPDHGKELANGGWAGNKSSQFRGVQWNMIQGRSYWAFACKGKGGHIFLALPDRSAPKVGAEDQWEKDHELKKAGLYDGGGR